MARPESTHLLLTSCLNDLGSVALLTLILTTNVLVMDDQDVINLYNDTSVA